MTKREKRYEKIRGNPKAVRPNDLLNLLKDEGFNVRRGGKPTHHVVSKEGYTFVIVESSPVKKEYVKRALEAIEFFRGLDNVERGLME